MKCPHCGKSMKVIKIIPPYDSRMLEDVPFRIHDNGKIKADEYEEYIDWEHIYLGMYEDMIDPKNKFGQEAECPYCSGWIRIKLEFKLEKPPI